MNESHRPPEQQALLAYRTSFAEANKLKDESARRHARQAVLRARNQMVSVFSLATLLRALNDRAGVTELLVWFWFNHFNVFWQKSLVGAALPSYVDEVIRPNARGRFHDLLLGTMTHPAMLVYLDNARNVAGSVNENYARELLELHTVGVRGGYSQADVQEVARVLTGFGLRPLRPVKWPPELAPQVRERGEFLFDPRNHDFGDKRVLGKTISGKGYAELEELVVLLAQQPATARYLAGKLCLVLAGERAPPGLVDRAAEVFIDTAGDLGKVVDVIQQASASLGSGRALTFKDPYRWLTSAVGLLAAGRPIKDARPIARWLVALGQPLFGCRTPDGYSLKGADWASSGQLTQRFELAREMVDASRRFLGQAVPVEEVLASKPVQALEAALGVKSRAALERAAGSHERLALLLASPEFMHW